MPAAEPHASYDPPPRLQQLPSWLSSELARRARRLVADSLAEEGRRRQHFSVLTSLAEQGPASQAELGRRLAIDRSDLHALVAELESEGLVERTRDPADRRRNVVVLSRAGDRTRKRLDSRIEAAQEQLLAPLRPAERREFRRLLEKLVSPDRAKL